MVDVAPLSAGRRRGYLLINCCSAPIWLAMVIAPRSRLARLLVRAATPLFVGLGVTYDVLGVSGLIQSGKIIDFTDPDSVRRALSNPDVFLAAWAHYIAFDLFVGRWIWQDSVEREAGARLALLLTWLAGPAGLSLYLVTRRAD